MAFSGIVLSVGWFFHLVSTRLRGVQIPHLALLTCEVEGVPCLLVRGGSSCSVHMVSMDTALEVTVLTPHCASYTSPSGQRKGILLLQGEVASPVCLLVYWPYRGGGAPYHPAERKVSASYVDLSDIIFVGVLSTLLLSHEVGCIHSHSAFAGRDGDGATVFLCNLVPVWKLTEGFLSC